MELAQKLAELAPKIMNMFHDLGRQHPDQEKLSMRQYQALIILNASGKLTLAQLCEKLCLAPSTGTELVNRMQGAGFIHKIQEPIDQRQVVLTITPRAQELLAQRQEVLKEMFQKFLDQLPPAEQINFVNYFEHIWALIEKYHILQSGKE